MNFRNSILAACALFAVTVSIPASHAQASTEHGMGMYIITSSKSLSELEAIIEDTCRKAGVTGCKVEKILDGSYRLSLPAELLETLTGETRSGESKFSALSRKLRNLIGSDTKVYIDGMSQPS
jgi:hypothetical protein